MKEIIDEWLEKGITWRTAQWYDISLRRMIKEGILPDIANKSLEFFYTLDHDEIIKTIKQKHGLTKNARLNNASSFSSLVKFVKKNYPKRCCIHDCIKDKE